MADDDALLAPRDASRTTAIAALLGILAVGVAGWSLWQVADRGLEHPLIALALGGGLVASNLVPMVSLESGRVSAFTPVGALLVPLGLLLAPAEAIVVYTVGETTGILISHRLAAPAGAPSDRPMARTTLTTAKSVLGAALAIVVMRSIATETSTALAQIAAAFAGVAVSSLFDHVALAFVALAVRGASLRHELARDLGELALIGAAEAVVGAMIAILAARDPWSLVLGLATFGLLLVGASNYARASADHEQTRALLVLAGNLQHVDTVEEVDRHLLACAADLFPEDNVAIATDEPGPRHGSWLLTPEGERPRWLVVDRIAATRDYEEQPFEVIDAAVALANSALTRALAQQQLLAQDRLRALVLSTAAHDLRSPLTSASGALRTLQRHINDMSAEQADDLRDLVGRSLQRALRLVDDLVELQRDGNGHVEVRPIDVTGVVGELLEGMDIGSLTIQADLQPTPDVATDRVGVERMVENLVLNAVKFSPPRGSIRVAVRPGSQGGVEIVVEDDGPGVPEEQRPKIFEAFEQAGSQRGGLGLGLYVAREFAKRAGGRIWVDGGTTGGAAFHVWLPSNGVGH